MCWPKLIAIVFVLGAAGAGDSFASTRAPAAKPAAAKPAAAKTAAARAVAEGWPASREGELAFRWVEAFGRGEEAMRSFYLADLAEKSLAERSMEARLARYRELYEKYGRLAFASVVKSAPGELTVKLFDSGASTHTFVFKAETAPPFRLLSVGVLQHVPVGHGGGHGGGNH